MAELRQLLKIPRVTTEDVINEIVERQQKATNNHFAGIIANRDIYDLSVNWPGNRQSKTADILARCPIGARNVALLMQRTVDAPNIFAASLTPMTGRHRGREGMRIETACVPGENEMLRPPRAAIHALCRDFAFALENLVRGCCRAFGGDAYDFPCLPPASRRVNCSS